MQHPHAELSAYIDGALAPAAQAAVQGHVTACAVCRAHLAQLRATVALVQALPDPVPTRRLVPRLAPAGPAWLAPLRTVMTLASGTAVFLFITSSLVSNITFLASGSPTSAQGGRDAGAAFRADGPTAAQPTSTPAGAPAPATSPNAALARNPTTPPFGAVGEAGSSPPADDATKRSVDLTAAPVAPGAGAPQEAGPRPASAEPQRSPLLNPWLWLALAILCGAIAIALQRRLRASV